MAYNTDCVLQAQDVKITFMVLVMLNPDLLALLRIGVYLRVCLLYRRWRKELIAYQRYVRKQWGKTTKYLQSLSGDAHQVFPPQKKTLKRKHSWHKKSEHAHYCVARCTEIWGLKAPFILLTQECLCDAGMGKTSSTPKRASLVSLPWQLGPCSRSLNHLLSSTQMSQKLKNRSQAFTVW